MPNYENIGYAQLHAGAFWDNSIAGSFDPNFCDGAIRSRGTGYARMNLSANTTEAWFHFTSYKFSAIGGGGNSSIIIRDRNNVALFAFTNVSNNSINHNVRYYDSGLTVQGAVVTNTLQRYTIDIFINSAAAGGGAMEFWMDNTQIFNVTGITGPGDNIGYIELWNSSHEETNTSNESDTYYSEMVIGTDAASTTVGRRVYSMAPTGDSGTNTAWTGDFSSVDDGGGVNDGNLIYTDTLGQRQGLTFPTIPAIPATIEGVGFNTRAFIGEGSARSMGHTIRTVGADFDQPDLGIDTILKTHETVSYTNPSTGLAWTPGLVNAAEFGMIST